MAASCYPIVEQRSFFTHFTMALADHARLAHICAMNPVTCNCGAVYKVIETKGLSRDPKPFKCLLCEKELIAWEGDNFGQLHLVSRPEQDRE